MRKIVLFIPLFSFLFLFTACGKQGGDLDSRIIDDSQDLQQVIETNETLEGVLKPQPITLNMYGTHLLEDEMGAFIIYLQSKKINLSAYLDSKVSITGDIIKTFDGKTIIEVNAIEILSTNEAEVKPGDQTYISQDLGINLIIPAEWQYQESEKLLEIFTMSDSQKIIEIEKIENEKEKALEKFVDEDEPVEITVNDFEAMRTVEGEQINVYISAGLNVYKIVYTPVEATATEKSKFYAFLKTFGLNQVKEKIKVCGGAAKIKCDSGYRCEIGSDAELATGLCIKIDATEEIDSKTVDLLTQDVLKDNAKIMPDSENTQTLNNQTTELTQDVRSEKFQVIDYINAHIKTLASQKGIETPIVQGYEFSENRVVSVILKTAEKKHKIQYQYNVVDEFEVALSETAYFEEGDGRDWVKVSGADAQWQTQKEVVSTAGETKAVVQENMRFYQSTQQNFSIQYPNNWYYGSFGAVGGALWHTGFSNEPVEKGNAKISVDIFSGKVNNIQENSQGGVLTIKVPRDENSHFEVYGATSYAETIRSMAGTISK